MHIRKIILRNVACLCVLVLAPALTRAELLTFQASDFGLTATYSNVTTFEFFITLTVPVTAGTSYSNPELIGVDYHVSGTLDNTPSGFPAFNLIRAIEGQEFYSQGSSMSFEVEATADLSDGVQVSELVGDGIVFEFNGREVGTGRYHPALVQLNADGTGSIRNSNNFGGINPSSGKFVDVDFGEEYITEMTFTPATLTLIPPPLDLILLDGFEND